MEFGQDEVRVINDDIPSSPTGGIHQRDRGDSINVVSEPDTNDEDAKHPEHLSLEIPVETKPLLPLLVPSLRGKMTYEGGMVTCKGVWGMSDIAHSQPGQTSDFEFKLVKADEGSGLFPVNGKYQGYFMLKQLAPLKGSIKVEDKEMMIKFTKSESDGRHEIQGKGINKFGSFTLRGTLYEDGNAQMYREYYNLTPTPLPSGVKRRLSVDGDDSAPKSTKKVARASTEGAVPPPPEISPRESSGRARKASSAMMEYMEMNTPKPPPTPKAPAPIPFKLEAPTPKQPKAAPATAPSSSSAGQYNTYGLGMPLIRHESTSDRAQRMPPYLKKCSELLKELSKHVQAQWFLEPVDPIKLGIPEYPSIITHPMDFSTIRKKIDEASYLAVEGFADDMRLVFRNAITFNVAKESIVNIAARDMSNRFEDRYRVMVSQLQGIQAYSAGAIMDLEIKTPRQSLGGGFGSSKKSVGASKTPRTSIGGVKLPSHTPGPRVGSSVNLAGMNYLPPAADGSAHQLAEMARMMSKMQSEMDQLRAQVRNNETITMLKDHQDAAHNPLTLDEKKTLIAQIHRLPPDSLEHVLEIIQSVMPPRDDNGDDIEIPLDALDTATLRKLQRYIETRPRPAPVQAAPVQRQMSSSAGGAPKRARKSTSSTKLGGGASSAGLSGGSSSAMTPLGVDFHGDDGDLPLLDEDDLLFTADSFEELKSNAQREGTSGASGIADSGLNNSAMMEDDDDFASLAAMHNDDAVRSDNINLGNSNAWNQ